MKLWIDDIRPAPEGYIWIKSVNEAKDIIKKRETRIHNMNSVAKKVNVYQDRENIIAVIKVLQIEIIDIDHDAGEYSYDGGDYIKLLDWLEETGRNYPIHIHSMNPVGIENMRRVIQKNNWQEIR